MESWTYHRAEDHLHPRPSGRRLLTPSSHLEQRLTWEAASPSRNQEGRARWRHSDHAWYGTTFDSIVEKWSGSPNCSRRLRMLCINVFLNEPQRSFWTYHDSKEVEQELLQVNPKFCRAQIPLSKARDMLMGCCACFLSLLRDCRRTALVQPTLFDQHVAHAFAVPSFADRNLYPANGLKFISTA